MLNSQIIACRFHEFSIMNLEIKTSMLSFMSLLCPKFVYSIELSITHKKVKNLDTNIEFTIDFYKIMLTLNFVHPLFKGGRTGPNTYFKFQNSISK